MSSLRIHSHFVFAKFSSSKCWLAFINVLVSQLLVQISKLFRDNLCSESTHLPISIRTTKTDWLCLISCFWGTGGNLRKSIKLKKPKSSFTLIQIPVLWSKQISILKTHILKNKWISNCPESKLNCWRKLAPESLWILLCWSIFWPKRLF